MEISEKKTITDAERLELAKKLDEDLENFINGLEKRQYTEGWPEDRWQEEMEKHPFFMKNAPEPGDKLSPLMEGLQQLKYDPNENTPDELATAYKDDGNFNFKHKNYRLAIIAYTEGIKVKCGNPEIESTLYNNRSAANYFLKNYRSALRDSELTLKINPDYVKAAIRAIKCCYEIQQYKKAIEMCDSFLQKDPGNQEIIELQQKCEKELKIKERDERKKQLAETKKNKTEEMLLNHIKNCGITIEGGKADSLKLEYLEPHIPELINHRVFLNETGKLVWPVIFTYPEYQVMDFIQHFMEDDTFNDHIKEVFHENPKWDIEKKYSPNNINVYFECERSKLHPVSINATLNSVLKNKEFIVRGGTPNLILLVRSSSAEKNFLKQYGLLMPIY